MIVILCDVIFRKLAKDIIVEFSRFYENVLCCALDNLGVKKVLCPLKNLENSPIMCFATKNNLPHE